MPPVFDAYVIVDWSARAVRKSGADSVWLCCLERRNGGFAPERLDNPPTRGAAVDRIADCLGDLVARGRVTLVGFDFAFGYPAGFAARVRPHEPTWRGVWDEIAARIEDAPNNSNNRFDVAAALNEKVSGQAFPFWGCPASKSGRSLSTRRPGEYGEALAEYRITERAAPGPKPKPKPVWRLFYQGSVGSQTLLGIARLFELRHHRAIADAVRIWPFETGLAPLSRPAAGDWRVLFAEVYPSMVPVLVGEGEVKDEAQVRGLARHYAALDDRDALAPLFAGPPELTDEERAAVEREEGWILGIEAVQR